MRKTKKILVAGMFTATTAFVSNAMAQGSADIDAALNGTYLLSFMQSVHSSGPFPFPQGQEATVVINGTDNTLCIDGKLLTDPYADPTGGLSQFFDDPDSDMFYAVSQLVDGSLNSVYVNQPIESTHVGAFRGDKISDSLECVGSDSGTVDEDEDTFTENGLSVSVDVKGIFDLAAELYPGVFKTPGLLREFDGFKYKYYRSTKTYIGFKDGKIFVMGGAFGTAITEYGPVATILAELEQIKLDELDINVPEGDFKLTITGRYVSSLISLDIPAIVINNMPAPDPNDVESFIEQSKELGATNVRDVVVQTINNSANHVEFSLEFTGDLAGLGTVNYKLNYNYTK